jgi:hypothetical protein
MNVSHGYALMGTVQHAIQTKHVLRLLAIVSRVIVLTVLFILIATLCGVRMVSVKHVQLTINAQQNYVMNPQVAVKNVQKEVTVQRDTAKKSMAIVCHAQTMRSVR